MHKFAAMKVNNHSITLIVSGVKHGRLLKHRPLPQSVVHMSTKSSIDFTDCLVKTVFKKLFFLSNLP